MRLNLALAAALAAAIPAVAIAQGLPEVANSNTEYASVGQSLVIVAGQDGAPEVIELGMEMIAYLAEDPTLRFHGAISSEITDNGTPTGKWVLTLDEKL